jgi:serine/threonine protein kinase
MGDKQPLVRMRPPSTSFHPIAPGPTDNKSPLRHPTSGPNSQVFNRPLAPLPGTSVHGGHKQVEKISLDGLSIGRYQLKNLIGGNPIGDVYLTYDRLREQDIALKTIQTNMIPFHLMEGLEDDYNLFQREWDLLQQVEHPHIVRVMGIGKSYISGYPFIYKTMPHYPEGSLANWLTQFAGRHFAVSDIARVILQVADAVQFLHKYSMLYQNFKMSNVLILNETTNMNDLKVALSDLPFVTDMINLPKTPESYRYFAPEQWEGEALPASDQYGLAVLAYELLTGRAPFQGNSEAIMRRMHLTMPAPPPSTFNASIYPFIDKVFQRALAKRPEERYESVSAFAAAFERAAN